MVSTQLGRVDAVSGQTSLQSQSYSKASSVPKFIETIELLPVAGVEPALTASAQQLRSSAEGAFGVDTLSASATSALGATNIALTLYPPPPGLGPVPLPSVQITADGASSQSTFNQVFPQPATHSGKASVNNLTIIGQLLGGGQIIHFNGAISPNTVLFQNAHVKVIGNQQTAHFGVCPLAATSAPILPTCEPLSRTTNAVVVEIHNAVIEGHKVSGTLVLGSATAGQ